MRHRELVASVSVVVALVAAHPAGAQPASPAVALVLEVEGQTEPELRAFREIRAGTSVRLAGSAKLVFLHYGSSCPTMTVQGGTVTFAARSEPRFDGGVWSTRSGRCPQRMQARRGTAAVMMRSTFAARLPAAPSFVLGGARADEIGSLRILRENREVLRAPLDGLRFRWPATEPPLTVNDFYAMELLPRGGGSAVATIVFSAVEAPPGDGEPIVLISVD